MGLGKKKGGRGFDSEVCPLLVKEAWVQKLSVFVYKAGEDTFLPPPRVLSNIKWNHENENTKYTIIGP